MKRNPLQRCQHPGCKNLDPGLLVKCESPGFSDLMLCISHCYTHGYCWRCGQFSAGSKHFDLNYFGDQLCEDCSMEAREQASEDYEPDRI